MESSGFTIQTVKAFLIEPLKFRMFPITEVNCASLSMSPGCLWATKPEPCRLGWMQHSSTCVLHPPCLPSNLLEVNPPSLCNLLPASIHRNLLSTRHHINKSPSTGS